MSVAFLMIASAPPSEADGGKDDSVFERQTTFGAADGFLQIDAEARKKSIPSRHTGTTAISATGHLAPPDSVIGATFCADANADLNAQSQAAPEIEALCGFAPLAAAPRVAPGREQVATAFRELGLYRGSVRTDPGIASLVNLETSYWCADDRGRTCDVVGEGERTVTLLGQPVRIRPRILRYDWSFGDGAEQRVAAGRAAHTYGLAGIMAVSVTLTWTADYAVGGGNFQAIGDTTTTTSPVRMLPVREAEAVVGG